MKLVVTSEFHYVRTPNGVCVDGAADYTHWARYLEVFDEVLVFSRVRDGAAPMGARRVEGPGVTLIPAPDFVGTRGLVRGSWRLALSANHAAELGDAFILHTPGAMATALLVALRLRRRSYGALVVGDPLQSLAGHRRGLHALRRIGAVLQRDLVGHASATMFVTQDQLQRAYPPKPGSFTIGASDVDLPDDVFDVPPVSTRATPVLRLGFVGTLFQPYKGLDVLLEALRLSRYPHHLEVVGDGPLRRSLQARAEELGMSSRVQFLGALAPGPPIFAFLRECDVFVLPSRTEGMPRALLEAMAVGLPCIATPVGGVPELLEPSELVQVGDPSSLARALDALAADPDRRRRLGTVNRERAFFYRRSATATRSRGFLEAVRASAWAGTRPRS